MKKRGANEEIANVFGKRLKTIVGCEITSKKFSEMMGMNEANTVSDWINGKKIPKVDKLIKMAKLLNVSIDYLVGLTDIPSVERAEKEICEKYGLSKFSYQGLIDTTDYVNDVIDTLNIISKELNQLKARYSK